MRNKQILKYFFFFLFFSLIFSCNNVTQPTKSSNTELVVTYNDQVVHRRGGKYVSLSEFKEKLASERELAVIFSADWCKSCRLTHRALEQANLQIEVIYVNIDDPWGAMMAAEMGFNSIPTMFHVGKDGVTINIRKTPGQIVTYLLLIN